MTLALLLFMGAPAFAQTQPAPPTFEPGRCPFTLPMRRTVECGTLYVRESRTQPDSAVIGLPVAIYRTDAAAPQPDPIVYLTGGPGGSTLPDLPDAFTAFASLTAADRDIVFFDQRGTGFAQPALECPEYTAAALAALPLDLTDAELADITDRALRACRARLAAAVDLSAYNTAENAADVDDLRQALGYAQINLLGISYGTRLALAVMRAYPDTIRSAVLDSVYPPDINGVVEGGSAFERVFRRLFDDCAASAVCHATYPNLETTLIETARRLDAQPVTVTITLANGDQHDLLLNGAAWVAGIYQSFYISELIPIIPRLIEEGSRSSFATIALIYSIFLEDTLSEGMYYAVTCQEDLTGVTLDLFQPDAARYPLAAEFYYSDQLVFETSDLALCRDWFVGESPLVAPAQTPVVSAIPTLLLAGEYDPVTPPAWAERAAGTLTQSRVYVFTGLGHGVIPAHPCPAAIALAFIVAPDAEPDAACLDTLFDPFRG